jgi:hypothetical protein
MENEVWKDIVGYEGLYEVSNLGNVKSLPKEWISACKRKHDGILLKKTINNRGTGYYQVGLTNNKIRKTRTIHQLVAEAFLNHNPCGYKLVIDHINNNTLDNRVENLQIITQRENAYKNQVSYSSNYKGVFMGCKKYKSKKTGEIKKYKYISSQINIDGKIIRLGTYKTEEDAHLAYQNALKKHELC